MTAPRDNREARSAAFVALLAPIGDTLATLTPEARAAVLDALHAAYILGKSRAYAIAGMHTLSAREASQLASEAAHLASVISGRPLQ